MFAGYDPKRFTLDHIGVAVKSIEEGKQFYEHLGFKDMHIEDVPGEKVRVAMIELANSSRIELLEPMNSESPIAKFLDKRGPGIHHICLRVQDIRAVLAHLKKQGVQLINESPNPGAHNCLVAFIHPRSAGGVLIELSEKRGEA